MSGIYNLSTEIKELEKKLYESADYETGEIDEEIVKALSVTREEFNSKAVGCVYLSRQFGGNVAEIDEEINRLKSLKDFYKRSADRLINGVSNAMRTLGIDEVRTPTMRLSFRRSEEAIIDNINFLPAEFVIEKIEYKPDKTAIKKAIKAGKDVQGAHVETKYNLQVK